MIALTYEQARNIIRDGDIIFIHGSWRQPLEALIMFFTRSKFSHCCIAFWVQTAGGTRLLCVEAQGGTSRRLLNFSFYADKMVTVIAAPCNWSTVECQALARVGQAPYGWFDAIYVGIREFALKYFNISLPMTQIRHEICSEFCASVYDIHPTEISPQLLYEELIKTSHERN